jgi:hypothetical protein
VLEPAERLNRISLTLRGERPTPEDLLAVTENPDLLPEIVDGYLESDGFAAAIRDLHNEMLLVRADIYDQLPALGLMKPTKGRILHDSITDAPLRLAEHIVMNDLPYTEIVQSTFMMTNDTVAEIWGLPFDPEGETWQKSRWVDGRPMAGVLSSSQLWRRHVSNGSNFHRGRANFVADTFLCADFATRDITVEGGIDLSDEFAVAHAVSTIPTCIGCHQALDPLAAFFWGWKGQLNGFAIQRAFDGGCHETAESEFEVYRDRVPEDFCYPLRFYTPAIEEDWALWDLRAPAFYGTPGERLDDLGGMIASDSRFNTCMVSTFYGYLTQTDRDEVPPEIAVELGRSFVASGYNARDLVREIVLSDRFATVKGLDDAVGVQTIRPEAYSRAVEQLTGFLWEAQPDGNGCKPLCWGQVSLSNSDMHGFRAMAGGIDSLSVIRPTHTATPTKLMVMERFAAEAAAFVVREDMALPAAERRLLGSIELGDSEDVVRAQIAELHGVMLAELVAPDSEEVDLSFGLWQASSERNGDESVAWTLLISAFLRDVRMLYY